MYPVVEKFLRTEFDCFHTRQTVGVSASRITGYIDVVGLRHVGGDLLGDVEVIGVEVKDDEPFLKSAGQTLGYGVMAHRCYLAANEDFNRSQRDVAAHLGIGLISIRGEKRRRCVEVQSAPPQNPVGYMCAELVEKMGYATCCVCSSPFQISDKAGKLTQAKHIVRSGERNSLATARRRELGYVYWLDHLDQLRSSVRAQKRAAGDLYDRRYLCASCVLQLSSGDETE